MKRLFPFLSLLSFSLSATLRADSVVVFNEIMYHPATNEPAMEWIEFHNQLAVDVDISHWSVSGGIEYTFPSNTIVRGRGYLVLAVSPAALSAATGSTNVTGPFTGRLSNNGERLELRNNSGRLVDEVEYGVDGNWPVAPDGSGVSLAKRDRDSGSAAAASWTWSAQLGGTPGAENFPTAAGFVAPPGLVSYWNFNEPGGSNVTDLAGRNHGVFGTGVTHSNASGVGGSLAFDGTGNAFVNVGPGALNNFAVSNGITIEAVLLPGWSGNGNATIFRRAPRPPAAYHDTVLADQPLAYWRLNDSTTTIT
ncbi:MAG TPA: lamin tail domain-containing protein, partial [Methylomirabilota bacterium]|nr:lamin tail domain-containing protein [Methylomirabilota bacterium]